ncbi:MAG: hypothetical protein AAF518_25825, partial [Spirochaetota bacterium]
MKLLKLIEADFFRDGGSYQAEWLTDKDIHYTLYLQADNDFLDEDEEYPNPNAFNDFRHKCLYDCSYQDIKNREPIYKNSPEEKIVLSLVDEWIKTNINAEKEKYLLTHTSKIRYIDEKFPDEINPEYTQMRLLQMRAYISKRKV